MSEKERWAPRIVGGLCVGVALLAIIHQVASNRPSAVTPLMRLHAERGAVLAMPSELRSVPQGEPVAKSGAPRDLYPPSDPELELVQAALSLGWWFNYRQSGLAQRMSSPEQMALERLKYRALLPYSDGGLVPAMEDGWECAGPAVNELIDRTDAVLARGGALADEDGMLGYWAVARRFARNDSGAGVAMTRALVRADLRDPGFYELGPARLFEYWDIPSHGESMSATVELTLLLDATGAPREALAEVLRLLLEEALRDDQRTWLMEEASLAPQETLAHLARYDQPTVDSDKMARAVGDWVRFQAARPLVVASVEDFLKAWRDRDVARLETTGRRMWRLSESGLAPNVASSMVGWHEHGPMPLEAWQYAMDCTGKLPRPARLEMARFVVAALLFHRDQGTWPQSLDELVPGYLPLGAIDPSGQWKVIAPAPLAAITRNPIDANFAKLLDLHSLARGQAPTAPEDLEPFALPGEDVRRYASRFVAMKPRPLFVRIGAADPCTRAIVEQILQPDTVFNASAFRWERVERPGFQGDAATRLRSGEDQWVSADLVGFLRVPPEGLLRLINPRREGAPE